MEELGCGIDEKSIKFLGTFEDAAAGGSAKRVSIDLYSGRLVGIPKPCSEIEELVWVTADASMPQLSPIIRNRILPFLVDRKLL